MKPSPGHDLVVLATRNEGKLRELARILSAQNHGTQIRLAGLDEFPGAPDVPETGATFEENALLKARAIADYTGLAAVAAGVGRPRQHGVLGGHPAEAAAAPPARHLLGDARGAQHPGTAEFHQHRPLGVVEPAAGQPHRPQFGDGSSVGS